MGCLCSTAKWKREIVPDHKFDYIDVNEFHQRDCLVKLSYSKIFILVFKAVLVYIADLMTAIIIGAWNQWSTVSPEKAAAQIKLPISFWNLLANYLRWIYVGSIAVSFLLLAHDIKKAIRIIKSRDISFAFTSVIAYRYYTLRSYSHYCFFRQINNHRKFSDRVALFVFFTLKGWKRLLLAEAPRQLINFILLWAEFNNLWLLSHGGVKDRFQFNLFFDYIKNQGNLTARFSLIVMLFVFLVWVINVVLVLFAITVYMPLLCKIRGNLKEYCCHMIDKRIGELMKKKARKRVLKQQQQTHDDPAAYKAQLPLLDSDLDGKTAAVLPSLGDEGYYAKAGYGEKLNAFYSTPSVKGSTRDNRYNTMSSNHSSRSGNSGYSSSGHQGGYNPNTRRLPPAPYDSNYSSPQIQPSTTYHSHPAAQYNSNYNSPYQSPRLISTPPPSNMAPLPPLPQQASNQGIGQQLPYSYPSQQQPRYQPDYDEIQRPGSPTETVYTAFTSATNGYNGNTGYRR